MPVGSKQRHFGEIRLTDKPHRRVGGPESHLSQSGLGTKMGPYFRQIALLLVLRDLGVRMRSLLISIVFLGASVLGATAEDEGQLTTLVTGSDVRGWEGVGRLNIGNSGFCTAALIAPDLLLTAAHCLYERRTGRLVDPSELEFLAGWRNNRASAYRGVTRAIPHPDYKHGSNGTPQATSRDVAILKLDQPIRNSTVKPFATGARPRKGSEVDVVSYAHNRASRPALQKDCHVLARPGESLILSCLVDFGSSGAPIFVVEDGEPRIVSVVSAMTEIRGRQVSFGTALTEPLDDLRALLDEESAPVVGQRSGVRRIATDEPRAGNGAKFLRP